MLSTARLLDAWTRLRTQAFLEHPGFVRETGEPAIRSFLAKGLAFVAAGRGEIVHRSHGDRLLGVFATWREDTSWYCTPCQVVALDLAHDGERIDPAALAWASGLIRAWAWRLGPHTDLMLDHRYAPLLDEFCRHGLGVDSVQLLGDPAHALSRLASVDGRSLDDVRRALDVEVRPLTVERVEEVIALKRALFRAHPEYCWFYSNPGFAEADTATVTAALGGGPHFVVTDRQDRVRGYFASSVDTDNAFWGSVGGMDLVLAPELQGRGLARICYRLLLRRLVDEGVRVFKGGTSQPPVLHLGRVMERSVLSWIVRRHVRFGPEHWAPLGASWPGRLPT